MREKIERVEDLEVFRRAYRLSLEIHKSSLALPRIEQFALADQLRRASKSICANLAEGFAKQSYSAAEYRRYLTVAIGSSDETQLWLRYCIDLGYTWDSGGSPTTLRSVGCCRVSTPVGRVHSDSWFLIPGVVAERSVGQ
jgi:four helix bundle protein